MEQGELFGGTGPEVFVGKADGLAFGSPMLAGVGHRRERSRFVLGPDRQPPLGVGGLDQAFFARASGS